MSGLIFRARAKSYKNLTLPRFAQDGRRDAFRLCQLTAVEYVAHLVGHMAGDADIGVGEGEDGAELPLVRACSRLHLDQIRSHGLGSQGLAAFCIERSNRKLASRKRAPLVPV